MKLKTYLDPMTVPERDRFARRCGTTAGHLSNVARHHRQPSKGLCARIIDETDGVVAEADLRPEWHGLAAHKPDPRQKAGRPIDWPERRAAAAAERAAAIEAMRSKAAAKKRRASKKRPARAA